MNKHMLTFCAVFTLLGLLSGCRSRTEYLPATEPSRPLATIETTLPSSEATVPETVSPDETVSPVHTVPQEELTEATIEDGNGPIPSQETK